MTSSPSNFKLNALPNKDKDMAIKKAAHQVEGCAA